MVNQLRVQGLVYPVNQVVDVTDVSETDQIGMTGSFYEPSSSWIDTKTDDEIWTNFLIPGNYFDPALTEEGDYNLYVSSGLFPLQPGQTEPISYGCYFSKWTCYLIPMDKLEKMQYFKRKVMHSKHIITIIGLPMHLMLQN